MADLLSTLVYPAAPGNAMAKSDPTNPTPRRGGRTRRFLYAAATVVTLGLAAALLLRNHILRAIVQPAIDATITGGSELTGLRWTGFARIGFDDLVVRSEGWEGPAADVLEIRGLSAELAFWPLFVGDVRFQEINVDQVTLRIAERADDPGSINLASLIAPIPPQEKAAGSSLGRMQIDTLQIEVGVAEGDRYTPTAVEEFNVQLNPIDVRDNLHGFLMVQSGRDIDDPTLIKGWWNPATMAFDLRLDGLDLESGSALAMSSSAREFCKRMELEGEIEHANVSWQPGSEPQASLTVKSIGLTIPSELGLEEHWVRFQDGRIIEELPPSPRMEVREGTIELDGDLIAFRGFSGRLVPADGNPDVPPVKISLEFESQLGNGLRDSSTFQEISDWGREMLQTAPFELNLTISEFVQQHNDEGSSVADLPRTIANALSNLQATEWNLAAEVTATRGTLGEAAPHAEISRDIDTHARVFLAGGRGAYVGFPYPLRKVSAQVEVINDDVLIHHLIGRGPHGHALTISGSLDGTDDDAGVNLNVQATRIPIDTYLFDALPPQTRRGVIRLFDQLAMERLSEAGLIVEEEEIASARNAFSDMQDAIQQAQEDGDIPRLARYRAAAQRLEAIIAAGPFSLGGLAAIDLQVNRKRGRGVKLIVEGNLDVEKVGAIFDQFPYPLVATGGRIGIEDEAILLEEPGIAITTPAGGMGRITGRIDVPRDPAGGRRTLPDLSFNITNDLLNPALLAAVPPDGNQPVTPATLRGWPGTVHAEAVKPLMELGVGGPIDTHARARSQPDGSTDIHATIVLRDGWLIPPPSESHVTTAGKTWPQGLRLEACEAILVIEPEEVTLRNFRGTRGEGVFTANGAFTRSDETARGRLRFNGIDIEPYMKDLFDPEDRPVVDELHARWQPRGTIDGTLDWSQRGTETTSRFTLQPGEITFNVGDRSQTLERESGLLIVADEVIEVEELVVRSQEDSSTLKLRGSIALEPRDAEHRLDVDFIDMTFGAPLVEEALRLSAGNAFGARWHDHEPQGGFAGAMSVETAPGDRVEVAIVPNRFTLLSTPGEASSRAGGDIDSGAIIHYTDGDLKIGPILVHGQDGALIDIEGEALDLLGTPRASASWRMRSGSSRVPETAFLPPPLSLIIGREGIATGPMDAQGQLLMTFREGTETPRTFDSTAELEFTEGTIDLGGVTVSGLDGSTSLRVRTADDVVEILEGRSTFPRALVENRLLENVRIDTSLAPPSGDPMEVLLTMKEGSLYGGPVRGTFRLQPETDRYQLKMYMDDVALSGLVDGEEDTTEEIPGRVLASLALKGRTGQDDSRVGRGEIRIRDADIAGSGTSMTLLRIGQLMLPASGGLDEAEISYLVNGGEAILSRILLDSPTLQLNGRGRLRFSDFSLAIRLLPRGQLGALSDLVSAVTGTVYAIDVEGTPANPKASLTAMPIMVSAPDLEPPQEDQENTDGDEDPAQE